MPQMQSMIPNDMQKLAGIQAEAEIELLDKYPNMVGVALGTKISNEQDTGEPCITALVSAKMDKSMLSKSDLLPNKIKDTPTDVVEIGEIFAGDFEPVTVSHGPGVHVLERQEPMGWEVAPSDRDHEATAGAISSAAVSNSLRRRIRPAQGGFSIGHYRITAGTLGTCCYDLTPFPGIPSRFYVLSNNHVLANANDARIGDPILQPGPYDGGNPSTDVIARLTRYVPIKFHTSTSKPLNYVDAAIAEGNFQDLSRDIYWSGVPRDLYVAPHVNDIVQKCGRTTGFTTGRVTNINATVDVNYGGGRVARFRNQIVTTNMSAPGDSGSLVMDRDEQAVGLLFAGSSTRTIVNNILLVQLLLKIRVHEK
jgi:hypothetical protein